MCLHAYHKEYVVTLFTISAVGLETEDRLHHTVEKTPTDGASRSKFSIDSRPLKLLPMKKDNSKIVWRVICRPVISIC